MADPATLPPGSDESRADVMIAVITLTCTLAAISVALRLYTRIWILGQVKIDDYFAVIALILACGLGVTMGIMTKFGLGRHIWTLQPDEKSNLLKAFYISILLYSAGLSVVKLTFLFQYFPLLVVQKMHVLFCIVILVVAGWGISQLMVAALRCDPISGFWDSTIQAKCLPPYPIWYSGAAGNIVTDLIVFFLPMPIVFKLDMNRTQKLVLLGIFCLGFFTVAISIIRIKFLQIYDDFSWKNIEAASWSIAELCSGIICACLATLRPFVTRHFPGLMGPGALLSSRGYQGRSTAQRSVRDVERGARGMASSPLARSEDPIADDTAATITDQHLFEKEVKTDLYETTNKEMTDSCGETASAGRLDDKTSPPDPAQPEDDDGEDVDADSAVAYDEEETKSWQPKVTTMVGIGEVEEEDGGEGEDRNGHLEGIHVRREIHLTNHDKSELGMS